ncbi:hypothetical protein AAHH80_33200, partial [Burkholderia pseudomallei]
EQGVVVVVIVRYDLVDLVRERVKILLELVVERVGDRIGEGFRDFDVVLLFVFRFIEVLYSVLIDGRSRLFGCVSVVVRAS